MADPFGVDLPTLIVQADSFAAQIRATPALAAAARPADPEAVRLALLAAARQADDALTARSLAQGDLDRANRRARAMVAEVSTWRAALLRDAQVLVDRGAVWAVTWEPSGLPWIFAACVSLGRGPAWRPRCRCSTPAP